MAESKPRIAEPGIATALKGTLKAPISMGETLRTKIERGDAYSAPEVCDLEITVLESLRGDSANRFMAEQKINDVSPQKGYEFLSVRISFGFYQKGRGFGSTPLVLSVGQFAVASEDGKTIYAKPSIGQQPVPGLYGKSFSPGQVREGWIILQVAEEEKHPLLSFSREYNEGVYGIWGFVWFRLQR